MRQSTCVNDEQLLRLSAGAILSASEMAALRGHIQGCPACMELFRQLLPPGSSGSSAVVAAPIRPAAQLFAAQQLVAGRYRIVRYIAQGGMGQVYQALDEALGIEVALKTILPTIAEDPTVLARFKREVLLARKVSHVNVCRIFDLGLHQQPGAGGVQTVHFLTMELLQGPTLGQRLRERERLEPGEVLPLLRQLAQALDSAHQQGVVHRDFKPDNVFLVPTAQGERVVVTDFGLARSHTGPVGDPQSLTSGLLLVGTPAYVAPEQVEGHAVGPAADVYALGVVLYEMITGQRPFLAATPMGTAVKRLTEAPVTPRSLRGDLDPCWEEAILRCLEREPSARPASCEAVWRMLEAEAPRGTMARVAEQGPQARPSASRRWRVTAVLLLGLGGGLALRREVRDELALIPGGTFEMGSSPDELRATWEWCQRVPGDLEDCNREVFEREQPLRRVSLPPFYMERTEVTNQRFVNWLNRRAGVRLQDGWLLDGDGESRLINLYPSYGPRFALRYSGGLIEAVAGEEQMPVVQVTWVGADRFCRSQGRRLPTEAEWEFTARSAQGHPFPWGAAEPRCDGVVFARLPGQRCAGHGALAGPQAVGTALQDRTALGVYDLGGNVAEWVQDRFLERYAPCALSAGCLAPLAEGSEGRSSTALSRVFRGGNWAETEVALRGTGRGRWLEDQGLRNVGFRCVSSRPAPPRR